MLSYKPNLDQTQFIQGMSFDEESRKRCEAALAADFPRLIKDNHKDGITFKDFLDKITNKIMATAPMVQEVVSQICQSNEFEVRCPSGRSKKSANLADDDIILPRQQFFLDGLNILSKKI